MKTRTHNFAGFTLVELVIALMLVAILGVSLTATLSVALDASKVANASIEPPRTADLAMQYLGSDLQSALPYMAQIVNVAPLLSEQSPALWFEGSNITDDRGHEADDVVFYGTADSPQHVVANGEIKQIELKVVEVPGKTDHVLVRRVIRNLLAVNGTGIMPDEEIICRGVNSFMLEYFDGSNWNPSWDSTALDNTIPVAVRVTLQLDRPGDKNGNHPYKYVRIFQLACSTAATDTAVNSGAAVN